MKSTKTACMVNYVSTEQRVLGKYQLTLVFEWLLAVGSHKPVVWEGNWLSDNAPRPHPPKAPEVQTIKRAISGPALH